ncbi:hypothetical protein IFR09_18255 [Pseudomonas syringae]|nr:hypothetical protein [Pseudomonas syringae]MBD8802398.1 hypothetical protein [Pseudomonas syringae]MBD8813108.1 hypothetical protein [Pseudomonas syringae]
MRAHNGAGQQPEARQRIAASHYGISRSRLGWLKVRFDGGPSYTVMVDVLERMVEQYGYLVRRGERLSGAEWIERILESRAQVTDAQKRSVSTLMRN